MDAACLPISSAIGRQYETERHRSRDSIWGTTHPFVSADYILVSYHCCCDAFRSAKALHYFMQQIFLLPHLIAKKRNKKYTKYQVTYTPIFTSYPTLFTHYPRPLWMSVSLTFWLMFGVRLRPSTTSLESFSLGNPTGTLLNVCWRNVMVHASMKNTNLIRSEPCYTSTLYKLLTQYTICVVSCWPAFEDHLHTCCTVQKLSVLANHRNGFGHVTGRVDYTSCDWPKWVWSVCRGGA